MYFTHDYAQKQGGNQACKPVSSAHSLTQSWWRMATWLGSVFFSWRLLWFSHIKSVTGSQQQCTYFHIDWGTFLCLFLCIKNTSSVCFLGLVAEWAGCRVVARIFEVPLMCCNEPEMRGWVITHKLLECFMWAQKKACTRLAKGTGRYFLNAS